MLKENDTLKLKKCVSNSSFTLKSSLIAYLNAYNKDLIEKKRK